MRTAFRHTPALAAALALVPVAANALTRPSPCWYLPAEERLVPVETAPATARNVYFDTIAEFINWTVPAHNDAGAPIVRIVLTHCPTLTDLTVVPARETWVEVLDNHNELVFSEQKFTVDRIGIEAAEIGAMVAKDRNRYGACLCDSLGMR